ncbi:hypothetical protein C8R43DRAFT_1121138 [Mycena crocata]|nr:hypothetical protein C8R43DRAFT_1121138 [Mycena crocata]
MALLNLGLSRAEYVISFGSAITDCLFLYRCFVIWGSSPWTKIVVAVPSLLILTTLITGFYYSFTDISGSAIPYALGLTTNIVLLGFTAGRIWRKGRQASVMMGPNAGRRYNTTLEIICESTLRLVVVALIYTISGNPGASPMGVYWAVSDFPDDGALAQVINIVPMMIFVRVGMAKDFSARETHEFRAVGGGSSTTMPLVSPQSHVKGFHGPYLGEES